MFVIETEDLEATNIEKVDTIFICENKETNTWELCTSKDLNSTEASIANGVGVATVLKSYLTEGEARVAFTNVMSSYEQGFKICRL